MHTYIKFSDRANYFIFAGRLDKIKGIDKLLVAWKVLNFITIGNVPSLLVVGKGPEEDWCKQYLASNPNLKDSIKLLGFVENTKTVDMIGHSLAILLPTQWYEGFPMTIVEAYSQGTPVLGSKIGNVGGLIINGITGYKFDSSSPECIAQTVQAFIKKININKTIDSVKNDMTKPTKKESSENIYTTTYKHYISFYTAEENYRLLNNIYNRAIL